MAASAAAALPFRGYEPSRRRHLLPPPAAHFAVSCRTRHRNLSSQQKRQQAKNVSPNQRSSNMNLLPPAEERRQLPITSTSTARKPHQKSTSSGLNNNGAIIETDGIVPAIDEEKQEISWSIDLFPEKSSLVNPDDEDNPIKYKLDNETKTEGENDVSSFQLEDLVGMIQNAEKNILLLNQARLRALEDVDKILTEKEALQMEINTLEMKLSETDARLMLATEGKVNAEILGDQLEKFRKEMSSESAVEGDNRAHHSESPFVMELSVLREENMLLKADIQSLKVKLTEVTETEECVFKLEKERSLLDASLRELESRFTVAQADILKFAPLQYDDFWEKVEHLQGLLDNAANQVEQAAIVLHQNHDLQDKVDKLEASLEATNASNFSRYFDELLQQKVKTLEERLQACDQDIHSQIQVYQQSVEEFQETLSKLIEESERRSLEHSADDMPSEFWSRILLMIDGWFFEKKISSNDASLLREMAWKRDNHIRKAYLSCRGMKESEVVETFLELTLSGTSSGLHIVHIAAEMAPVAKVGGLADVVSGLGKALQKKGHLVEIILPKYDCMQSDQINNLRVLDVVVQSYFEGNLFKNKIWTGTVEGLPVYFIEPQHPANFFWRAQYYGEHDDFKRFSFFSRAALELLYQSGKKIDIIHCHDWQTAFVAPLYWDLYANRGFNSARICFTCHNFEYQGTAPAPDLAYCGLDVQRLDRPDRMQDNSHGRINVVKGAIVYSNIVTTVSPTYALEVRFPGAGRGLQDTLKLHSRKFVGILNGIDTETWSPSRDRFIKVQYNANDLQGKAANKEALRKQLKLSSSDASQPLVGCITRLVPQKGVHLIRHAIYRTAELGGQFVLLGSSPVPHIQREFEGIADHFKNNPDIRLLLKYDDALSHWIYAASDMFIVPSIFEPCGLTQMIAMRYGSVPIVRKTGGLNDSVFDFDDGTIPMDLRNGFTFVTADEQGLSSAMERAFNYYTRKPVVWKQLVQKDMRMDFSWESSASQYEELYQKAVARARATAQN